MLDEPPAGGGEADAPAGRARPAARLPPLELRQLLGDRGGREAKRLGGARDRAAQGDLPKDPKPADVEHKQSLTKRVAT